MDTNRLRQDFERYLVENNEWMSWSRLDYAMGHLLQDTNVKGKSVLEIGAGDGFGCVWCLMMGAEHVVAIEPEVEGCTGGVNMAFSRMSASIGIQSSATYLPFTLDQYYRQHEARSFDLVLMKAVINHLDEKATSRLHIPEAEAERNRYRVAFGKIFDLMNPGGALLIYDVGRRNFWNDLRLRNRMAPTLDFRIHQQPGTWWALLQQYGFVDGRVCWPTPYRLRHFRILLSNAVAAYFLMSAFTLCCHRPGQPVSATTVGQVTGHGVGVVDNSWVGLERKP